MVARILVLCSLACALMGLLDGTAREVLRAYRVQCKLSGLIRGGHVVLVDGSGWLHEAVHRDPLAAAGIGQAHRASVAGVRNFTDNVNVILAHGGRPIVIFDGDLWPLKDANREGRLKVEADGLAKAREAYARGDRKAALEACKNAARPHDDLIDWILDVCDKNNVEYRFAPFEADGQAAWMLTEFPGAIILAAANDTDFQAYDGMRHIIYDLKKNGDCTLA